MSTWIIQTSPAFPSSFTISSCRYDGSDSAHRRNTPNATSGVSAEFASATDHTVFSKTGSLNASDAITDVPWLELTAIAGQGTLAKTAFRLDTVGGQPPASVSTYIRVTTDRSAQPRARS